MDRTLRFKNKPGIQRPARNNEENYQNKRK